MFRVTGRPAVLFGVGALVLSTPWVVRLLATPTLVRTPAGAGENGRVTFAGLLATHAISSALATENDRLDDTLLRAGLDPEALAAAGVGPVQVSSIVDSLEQALAGAPHALIDADAQYATARAESDRLRRLIESGKSSQEDRSAYQSQLQALASAQTARDTALNAFRSAAAENLSGPEVTALANIRANRGRELPVQYLVVNRNDAEWVALRDALANEKIAPRHGEEPDPAQQAALAQWRANPAVSLAKTNLDTNLPAIKASWTSAVGN